MIKRYAPKDLPQEVVDLLADQYNRKGYSVASLEVAEVVCVLYREEEPVACASVILSQVSDYGQFSRTAEDAVFLSLAHNTKTARGGAFASSVPLTRKELMSLFDDIQAAAKELECSYFILLVTPDHAKFWKRVRRFEPIASCVEVPEYSAFLCCIGRPF